VQIGVGKKSAKPQVRQYIGRRAGGIQWCDDFVHVVFPGVNHLPRSIIAIGFE
jgi:hypothetical protein